MAKSPPSVCASSLRRLFSAAAGGIVLAAILTTSAQPAEAPKPSDRKVASVRFWNLLPAGSPALDVVVTAPGVPETTALPGSVPGDVSGSSYWELDPGSLRLVLRPPGEGRPSAAVDRKLAAGDYLTIVAQADAATGKPALTVIDDAYEFREDAPGLVTIFCIPPGHKAGYRTDGQSTRPLDPSGTTAVTLPPGSQSNLALEVERKPGKSSTFELMLDFKDCKSYAVVLSADRYGRMRPQTFLRGYVRPLPEEPAAEATP